MKIAINIIENQVMMDGVIKDRSIPLFKINNRWNINEVLTSYIEIINDIKYREVLKYAYGQTQWFDIVALVSLIYDEILSKEKETGVKMLEVGSWFGCSSVFNALALKYFSKDNILFCMDTWKGSQDEKEHDIANFENALEHFRAVMRYMNVDDIINPLVCDSVVGMDALRDNYYDIIFIDAAHNYKNVYEDIKNAIRLVKPGGLIIGHDCECKFKELDEKYQVKTYQEEDPHHYNGYHIGVIRALDEIFGEDYNRFVPSIVWYKRISTEDKIKLLDELDKKSDKCIETAYKLLQENYNEIMQLIIKKDDKESFKQCIECIQLIDETVGYINSISSRGYRLQDTKLQLINIRDDMLNLANGIQNNIQIMIQKYSARIEDYLKYSPYNYNK